jgi:zinc protease
MSGVVIAASGGLSTDETLKLLETCFATANVDGPAPPIAIPDVIEWPARRRDFHTVPEKTQSDLVIGLPGIRRTDPDYYALSLADTIFGRIGMGGRLGEEIRERRGLAYYASTSLEAGFGPGPWAARIGVAPKDVNQALEATLAEWHRFTSEGPTEQELRDAQQLLTGSLPLRLETSEGIASQLIIAERFGLSLDLIEEYTRAILATTLDDIRTALQRHFDERRVVAAIAGPA